MTWETIRNAGYLLKKDDLKDGVGIRKSREFLYKVTKAFAFNSINYFDKVGELPFIYRERQINSILLPSIAKVSDAVFAEHPIKRRTKGESSHGWIDYWVMFGSTVFLVELKHAWCSTTSNVVRKVTRKAWQKAIDQLKKIPDTEVKSLSIVGGNLVKMALVIVPFYQASKNRNKLVQITDKDEVEEIHDGLVTGLTPPPDWSCIWLLHDRLQEPVGYGDGTYEIYPCVGIIARVG
ncbi:MAG: hypothetical protein ACYC38_12550 [Eubacteriales bacterium]